MGFYNTDGTQNYTQVTGLAVTGLYAPNGGLNIVLDSSGRGLYHPCGALRVNSDGTNPQTYDPTGALYIGRLLDDFIFTNILGLTFLVGSDGAFLRGSDGAYLMGAS